MRLLLALIFLLPAVAPAEKVYKWVDKDGKVTYQQTPPPAGANRIEEKHINPDQNVIASEPRPETPSGGSGGQQNTGGGDPDNNAAAPVRNPAGVLEQAGATGDHECNTATPAVTSASTTATAAASAASTSTPDGWRALIISSVGRG